MLYLILVYLLHRQTNLKKDTARRTSWRQLPEPIPPPSISSRTSQVPVFPIPISEGIQFEFYDGKTKLTDQAFDPLQGFCSLLNFSTEKP